MKLVRGRQNLQCSLLAMLMIAFLSLQGSTVMGEDTTVVLTKFDDYSENLTLSFVNNDESFFDLPDIPGNATIIEARFNVTGIKGFGTSEDRMDFSTDSVGADLWARHSEGTGLYPVNVSVDNNTWSAILTAQVANIKAADGNTWHTNTSSYTNSTPWEYPVQLYHFRHDAKNVSMWNITWKGHGTCTANTTWENGAEMWVYRHSRDVWQQIGSYSSSSSANRWLNYSLEPDQGYVSSNGSMDIAIVGPHAIENGTDSDYGHLYTDYIGLIAQVNTTQEVYPEDVLLWWGGYHLQISNGPLNGTVLVGDAFGLKDAIQETLDDTGGTSNVSISIDVYVKEKTTGRLLFHDLWIEYGIDVPVPPDLPPRWVGDPVVTTEEDSDWTAVVDLDASFTDDHDQGNLVFTVRSVTPLGKLETRLAKEPLGNWTLEVKPAADFSGDVAVTLTATDTNSSETISPPITVHVMPVPDAPKLMDPGRLTAYEDTPFKTTLAVIDPDLPGDELAFSDDSDLFDIDQGVGVIEWTPTNDDVGVHEFTVNVTDEMGLSDELTLTLEVLNVNDVPKITSGTQMDILEGEEARYTITAEDDDLVHGDVLTYSAYSMHGDAIVDPASGELVFTPNAGFVGEVEVVLKVEDAAGASDDVTLVIDVVNVNDPPTLEEMEPIDCLEDKSVYVRLTYDDPDLAHDLEVPEVLSITSDGPGYLHADALGWINVTPDQSMVGVHMVTYTVADREGLSASIMVEWIILNVNDDPVIVTDVPGELVAREGEPFSYTLEATDIDGDTLTWSDSSSLFDINPETGTISFTPSHYQVGTHPVTVTVSDGNDALASVTFDLVVENVNGVPVIVTVLPLDGAIFEEGEPVRFSVEATDGDGDALTYTWMEGDTELGAGTPFKTMVLPVGTHTITLVVTDGTAQVDQSFQVVIVKAEVDPSEEDEGMPITIILMLVLGIAVGVLTLVMFLWGRIGPSEPPEGQ